MMSPAELVFVGGSVFADRHIPGAGAAITAGRIVAVGDVQDAIGPLTRVVDLEGGLLAPSFTDAHIHPVWGALDLLRCSLSGMTTHEEYSTEIARYAAAHPELEWIVGGGWSLRAFPPGGPRASDLHRLVGGRPALLWSNDGHVAWASSRALELAGIDAHTADPADGRLGRTAGEPNGLLYEGAMALVTRHMPAPTLADFTEALLLAQRMLHAVGVTGWQDASIARADEEGDPAPAYRRADRDGSLVSRVSGALWWDRRRGLDQIDQLLDWRAEYSGRRFRTPAVKIMQDGIIDSHTAALIDPYADSPATGPSLIDADALREIAIRLDAVGFQLHFHAIGDRAVRECLDAVDAAVTANGPRERRHHIAHVHVVHPDDRARFAALGVVANIQPYWAHGAADDATGLLLGAERAAAQYPFGALLGVGARLAGGSDWPVTTPDPLAGIHVAVNRRMVPGHPGAGGPVLGAAQRLTVADALTAYCAGSAYVNDTDADGRIAVGSTADVITIDRDLFRIPSDEIGLARVTGTYIDGARVYEG